MSTLKVDGIRSNSASSDAITLASDGTCTANITNNLSNRNLVINGAMQVAQRGTSSTSNGYQTVDRWYGYANDIGSITATWSQGTLTSSDTPYSSGFRNYHRVTLSAAGTANAGSQVSTQTRIEAQDISTSGWNYTSSSSFLTASCWVRASTGQTFYLRITSEDGTKQNIPFAFTVADNTWTKVTWTLPGNSNSQFDNDNGEGLRFYLIPWHGTTYTSSDTANNTWAAYASGTRVPDMASTWLTAGASTFDYTGVQLEVGSVATDFEHRSYGDELARCQRYYQVLAEPAADNVICFGGYVVNEFVGVAFFPQEMRTTPTLVVSDFTNAFRVYGDDGNVNPSTLTTDTGMNTTRAFFIRAATGGTDVGDAHLRVLSADSGVYATIAVSAEL